MRVRLLKSVTLTSTGLLAGAFGYGAVNLTPTFRAVPLDMRLTFHARLMRMNSPVMVGAMTVSTLSSLSLARLTHGPERRRALGAGLLTAASFAITRFGNVPINARIKTWAVTEAPADHARILRRWERYNVLRTVTAVGAFALLADLAPGRLTQQ
ncbi:anthrone oxygenase family protein [Kitasatospora sp. NPDC056531]|uniref:anthrone oxygenase family protein n=1 Tax=Kitasatospora sp. NPDC056531 TaxID=3345856 RepID=UPI0036974718